MGVFGHLRSLLVHPYSIDSKNELAHAATPITALLEVYTTASATAKRKSWRLSLRAVWPANQDGDVVVTVKEIVQKSNRRPNSYGWYHEDINIYQPPQPTRVEDGQPPPTPPSTPNFPTALTPACPETDPQTPQTIHVSPRSSSPTKRAWNGVKRSSLMLKARSCLHMPDTPTKATETSKTATPKLQHEKDSPRGSNWRGSVVEAGTNILTDYDRGSWVQEGRHVRFVGVC